MQDQEPGKVYDAAESGSVTRIPSITHVGVNLKQVFGPSSERFVVLHRQPYSVFFRKEMPPLTMYSAAIGRLTHGEMDPGSYRSLSLKLSSFSIKDT